MCSPRGGCIAVAWLVGRAVCYVHERWCVAIMAGVIVGQRKAPRHRRGAAVGVASVVGLDTFPVLRDEKEIVTKDLGTNFEELR